MKLLLLFALASGVRSPFQGESRRIETRVDPRVEMLTIVARLAGFPEFNQRNSRSRYAEEVERHFGTFRGHPAVATLKAFKEKNGVSYDAIPSLAVHLDGVPALGERIPFDAPPERLEERWGAEGARGFLVELRRFAEESKSAAFFEAHRPLYEKVEKRLAERLSQTRAIPWFDSFFGTKPGARIVAVAGLLCGGGNYGVGVRFPDGRPEEITPVFGCWTFDAEGVPVFAETYLPLFVHELCHTYTNPFVDRIAKDLEGAGSRIYGSVESAMKGQAYGTWKTTMVESLVRACTIRCRLATEGKEAAEEQAREERKKQFAWVPELAERLGAYESDRTKYPTFDAFLPEVVAFFDGYAARLAEVEAERPKVESTKPANGATDVDPALTTLTVRFDRPMLDRSWAFTGSKEDMPEIAGIPSYDAAGKVLTLPIRLQPGRGYRFGLNSESHRAFQSREGVPLAPVEVTFRTRSSTRRRATAPAPSRVRRGP